MYVVNQEDEQLIKIVANENIKMFNSGKNKPDKKIFYDLMNAFPIERTGKNGDEVKIISQELTGNGIPSVVVTNNSNSTTLVPVNRKLTVPIIQMAFDVLIDKNKIDDGLIDPAVAIKKATQLLKYIDLSLMLKGDVLENNTGKTKNLVKYSLLNISSKFKTLKSVSGMSSNEINSFIANEFDAVVATGFTPDTWVVSARALRAIVSAPAEISEDKFLNFNKDTLDLNIYPTEFYDDCGTLGACGIMYKNSAEVLKLIYGKEASVRSDYKDNYNRKDTIVESFGGFANVTEIKDAIRCQTNLLG